jgi:hypothetical protein
MGNKAASRETWSGALGGRLPHERLAIGGPGARLAIPWDLNMQTINRRALLLSALAAGFSGPALAAVGSIRLKVFSAGLVIGAGGGKGVLEFRGARYPLSVGGVSLGATIGISGADLIGTASNLNDAHDIEGAYSAAGAGVAVAGGVGVMHLSNAKGVVLRLKGRHVGFKFSLAVSGLTISLA